MEDKLLSSEDFIELMRLHGSSILSMLLYEDMEFTVLANLQGVSFEPELPSKITKKFQPIIPFAISNYALQSAEVDDDYFSFETGFGKDNIGSVVSIRLDAILQIIVGESVIFINRAIVENFEEDDDDVEDPMEQISEPKEEKLNKSLKAFMQNPENKKLFD